MARFKQSFNLSKSCSGCKFNSVGVLFLFLEPEMQRLQPASIQETKESEQRGWEQTSLMEKQVSYECLYCIECFVRWCFSFTSSMLTINRVLLRVKQRPRFCLIQHFSFADIGVLGFLMCPSGECNTPTSSRPAKASKLHLHSLSYSKHYTVLQRICDPFQNCPLDTYAFMF